MISVRVKWPNIWFRLRNSNKAFLRSSSSKIWKSKTQLKCLLCVYFNCCFCTFCGQFGRVTCRISTTTKICWNQTYFCPPLTILIPCRTFPLIYFCFADVTCNFLQREFLKQENWFMHGDKMLCWAGWDWVVSFNPLKITLKFSFCLFMFSFCLRLKKIYIFKAPQVVDTSPEHFSFHRYSTLNEWHFKIKMYRKSRNLWQDDVAF